MGLVYKYMKEYEKYNLLWEVQSAEQKGIFLKDFDPMDVAAVLDFSNLIDNYIMMCNALG